jgi:hypothetical protein
MNTTDTPFVVKILHTLSLLSLVGGVVLAVVLSPGDPGVGYSWKVVAYTPMIFSVIGGIVQYALFAALSKIVEYLSKIEINTRQAPLHD